MNTIKWNGCEIYYKLFIVNNICMCTYIIYFIKAVQNHEDIREKIKI